VNTMQELLPAAISPQPVRLFALPCINPDMGRNRITVSEGLTISELVTLGFPGASSDQLENFRVIIGEDFIPAERWGERPKAGDNVFIRIVPGKGGMAAILGLVISIASLGIGSVVGGTAGALLGGVVKLAGGLLLQALIPVPKPKDADQRPRYSINGFQNELRQDAPVPMVLGKVRYAPPFGAAPWTEAYGQRDRYIHAIFNCGYGPLAITNIKIGDSPITDFKQWNVDARYGYETDTPIGPVYPSQVIEESLGVHLEFLAKKKITDLEGGEYDTAEHMAKSNPVRTTPLIGEEEKRYTATDASGFSIDLSFPQGVIRFSESSGNIDNRTIWFRIRYRLNGEGDWIKPTGQDMPIDMCVDPDTEASPLVLTQGNFTGLRSSGYTLTLSSGAPRDLGLRIGDIIQLSFFDAAVENGVNFRVLELTATGITVAYYDWRIGLGAAQNSYTVTGGSDDYTDDELGYAIFDSGGVTFEFHAIITLGQFHIGDIIKFSGLTIAGNNGVSFKVTGVTASHLNLVRVLTTVASPDTLVTITRTQRPYANFQLTARDEQAFVRTFSFNFPDRGRYQVSVTRISNEDARQNRRSACDWTAIRSLRPEVPTNYPFPCAQLGVRIKATRQLNGTLDNLNCILSRICLDWDADTETWILRETNNPASLLRWIMQGPANAYPFPDSKLDLPAFQTFHEHCTEKGLEYNGVIDSTQSLYDVMAEVARAGRGLPLHTSGKWTIIIDRPQDIVCAHIGARNSWGFDAKHYTARLPDAFRVKFADETNNYEPAERTIPFPDFEGVPQVFEMLDLPGITDPDKIWREARRRQYEIKYRSDRFTVFQDWEHMISTRGDLIELSHHALKRKMQSGRVKAVSGNTLTVDTECEFESGKTYQVKFRKLPASEVEEGNPPFLSITRTVTAAAGDRTVMTMGAGTAPNVGDLFFFGETELVTERCIVQHIERADKLTARLTVMPSATTLRVRKPAWDAQAGLQ